MTQASEAATGRRPHARAGCQAATSRPTARATSNEPSSRATWTWRRGRRRGGPGPPARAGSGPRRTAPSGSPLTGSPRTAARAERRARRRPAGLGSNASTMAALRSGTGSASRTRTIRWRVASSSDQAVQARHPARWVSTGPSGTPAARRRAGPTGPLGLRRTPWQGWSSDYPVWFPATRLDRRWTSSRRWRWRRRRGDRVAVTAFVRRTPARGVAGLRPARRAAREADDLTQEVYLRALPALARFRADASARDLAPADRPARVRRPRAPGHPVPGAARSPGAAR